MNKTWTKNDCNILNKIFLNYPQSEIMKLFPTKQWNAIRAKAMKLGLKRKNLNGKSDIFNLLKETPEAYYWIGFLFADGYFNHKTNLLNLAVAIKDKRHLEKFSKFIDGGEIREYTNPGSTLNNRKIAPSQMCAISQADQDYVKKIIKKFDFNPRKTYNPPNKLKIINNDMFVAMVIGYIDGDGSITKDGRLSIACHNSWANCLTKWFQRIWGRVKKDKKIQTHNSQSLKNEIIKLFKDDFEICEIASLLKISSAYTSFVVSHYGDL